MGLRHTIWYNKLLRRIYKGLPLPWHIKHRLREIYLRAPGAWKVSQDFFQPVGNWDTLRHIASNGAQFDAARPWILVVDSGLLATDHDSGRARMSMLLHLLREKSFNTTFVSDSNTCSPEYRHLMEQQGIEVISGWSEARRHLADTGGRYHFVLLSQPEVAFKYLPHIRAHALYSKVIYATTGSREVRSEREMHVSGTQQAASDIISHYRWVECFNAICADFVLAASDEEKERLLVEHPDIEVMIYPHIHDFFGGTPADICRRLPI